MHEMYWLKDNAVYVSEGTHFRNVSIAMTGKSLTVKPGKMTRKALPGAVPVTLDELKCKFHLDADNPIKALGE